MGRLAHMQTLLSLSELPFAERVLVQNVSHENDLIFMWMTVQVTHIFIPIVSHKDSFCHRGKSKLGIGLFIHELLREPLIIICWRLRYFVHNKSKTLFRMASDFWINIDYSHRVRTSIFYKLFYESSHRSQSTNFRKHQDFLVWPSTKTSSTQSQN